MGRNGYGPKCSWAIWLSADLVMGRNDPEPPVLSCCPCTERTEWSRKWRLAYATEIADFYRMQIVAKKKKIQSGVGGWKGEGRSGFRKQDIFFFFFFFLPNGTQL